MAENLVLIRHGQSVYNSENRFAGWVDTDLTKFGEEQAKKAGIELKNSGFMPDEVFCSPFTRTKKTADIILSELGFTKKPKYNARIVERFYGDLTGKNKEQSLAALGDEMFQKIRRGYETEPPAIKSDHPQLSEVKANFERLIGAEFAKIMPSTESLKDVEKRVIPFYESELLPLLKTGKKALIVAHGNSLRALIKIIKNFSADEISKVELETAHPHFFSV